MLNEVSSVEYEKYKKNKKNFKTAIGLGKWKKSIVNHLFGSVVSTPNNDGLYTAGSFIRDCKDSATQFFQHFVTPEVFLSYSFISHMGKEVSTITLSMHTVTPAPIGEHLIVSCLPITSCWP